MRYEDVLGGIQAAYDRSVAERDSFGKQPWKLTEREAFLGRLRALGARTLVEIGAGILIVPGGLFYLGLWGSESFEGALAGDHLGRFFSFRTGAEIRAYAEAVFDVADFHTVTDGDLVFQSLALVRRPR